MSRGHLTSLALFLLLPALASLELSTPPASGALALGRDARPACFEIREFAPVPVWPRLRGGGEVVGGLGRCQRRCGPHDARLEGLAGRRGGSLRLRGGAEESEGSGDDQGDDETGWVVREWRLEELARVEAFKRAPPNPMAVPLSSAKLTERVLRYVERHAKAAARQRALAPPPVRNVDVEPWDPSRGREAEARAGAGAGFVVGIRRVTAAMKKADKLFPDGGAILILAADVMPFDLLCHLPITSEEAHVPYIFVPNQLFLGEAAQFKSSNVAVVLVIRPVDETMPGKQGLQRQARLGAHFDRLHARLLGMQHLALPPPGPPAVAPPPPQTWDDWTGGGGKERAPASSKSPRSRGEGGMEDGMGSGGGDGGRDGGRTEWSDSE